jgi:hypothetical protein
VVSNIDVDAKFRTPCLVLYKKRIPCEYILFLLDKEEPKVVASSSREEVEKLSLDFKSKWNSNAAKPTATSPHKTLLGKRTR